jgi:hypothetical protein
MKKTILTTFIIIGTMALAAGQTLIKDIYPGSSASMGSNSENTFVEYNGAKYFFAAYDGYTSNSIRYNLYGIFKMTGTSIEFVTNVDHGSFASRAIVNNTLYYTSYDVLSRSYRLHSFDGTTTTRHIIDPTDSLCEIRGLHEFDNKLVFRGEDIDGYYSVNLFSYDGTNLSLIDRSYNGVKYNSDLYYVKGSSYKIPRGGTTTIYDLWKYDGTNSTQVTSLATLTIAVKDVYIVANNRLYFTLTDNENSELWQYDGTTSTKVGSIPNQYINDPIATSNSLLFSNSNLNGGVAIYQTDGSTIDSLTPFSTLGFGLGRYGGARLFVHSPVYNKVYFTKEKASNNMENIYSVDLTSKEIDTVFYGDKIYPPFHISDNGQLSFGQIGENGNLLWTIKDDKNYLLCDTVGKQWARSFWNMTSEGDTLVFTTSIGGDDYIGDEPHKISLTPVLKTNGISMTNNQQFQVYPNPTSSTITVKTEQPTTQIQVLNLAGQVLKTFTQTNNQINVSDLTPGVYLLQVTGQDGIGYSRFIKN